MVSLVQTHGTQRTFGQKSVTVEIRVLVSPRVTTRNGECEGLIDQGIGRSHVRSLLHPFCIYR